MPRRNTTEARIEHHGGSTGEGTRKTQARARMRRAQTERRPQEGTVEPHGPSTAGSSVPSVCPFLTLFLLGFCRGLFAVFPYFFCDSTARVFSLFPLWPPPVFLLCFSSGSPVRVFPVFLLWLYRPCFLLCFPCGANWPRSAPSGTRCGAARPRSRGAGARRGAPRTAAQTATRHWRAWRGNQPN